MTDTKEGLEVVAWQANNGQWACCQKDAEAYTRRMAKEMHPLCRLSGAQAIIDQLRKDTENFEQAMIVQLAAQAARIKELAGLLAESVGMVRGTVGNQDSELADRIDAAIDAAMAGGVE